MLASSEHGGYGHNEAHVPIGWEPTDRAEVVAQTRSFDDLQTRGFKMDSDHLHQSHDSIYSPHIELVNFENPQIKIDVAPSRTSAEMLHRPPSATSTDTYRQASTAFLDFDGVHYIEEDASSEGAVNKASLAALDEVTSEARLRPISQPPETDKVFYPAPVPVSLNLPQRLSKLPPPNLNDDCQSRVLPSAPPTVRRHTTWLVPGSRDGEPGQSRIQPQRPLLADASQLRHSVNDFTQLPPQLRATTFFEHPPTQHSIVIKGNSAVETLESILDASTDAPVGAFSTHPMADRVSEARRSFDTSNRRASRTSLGRHMELQSDTEQLATRDSVGKLQTESTLDEAHALSDDIKGLPNGGQRPISGASDLKIDVDKDMTTANGWTAYSADPRYQGQPTTLLAELQLRKEQLRQRTMVAATAYPKGMRSTLLELDSVAEVQQRSRMNKRTTLAWEDPQQHNQAQKDGDYEEVPLALLYPNRNNQLSDGTRPMGLLEKRDLEDNEPLSRRRERLRNSQHVTRKTSRPRLIDTDYRLEVPGLTEGNQPQVSDGEDDEPLAQRARKMRARHDGANGGLHRSVSKDFATELIGQFGVEGVNDQAVEEHGNNEEETLAQRKQRLQAEQLTYAQERNKYTGHTLQVPGHDMRRRTMANILQAHPVPLHPGISRLGAYQTTFSEGFNGMNPYAAQLSSHGPGPYANFDGAAVLGLHPAAAVSMPCGLNVGNFSTSAAPHAPAALDPGQRDKIDRWRFSVIP